MNEQIIIHISGFPGSGKTTLGESISKKFPKLIVYDTDLFIQHHISTGKQLLQIEKQIDLKRKTIGDYKIAWFNIIKKSIDEFIETHPNETIVFVGSLDNWAPPNTIYDIKCSYKFVLDIPLDELMKRYYTRICLENSKVSKASQDYWNKLSKGIYNISSSDEIISKHKKYNEWHEKHHYEFLSDKEIVKKIKEIIS